MAQPDVMPSVTEEATRRRFLQLATAILGALGAVVLAIPLVGAIAGPAFRRKARRFAKVAEIDALPTGQPVSVTFASETRDAYLQETGLRTVWVVKHSQDAVVVYSPICPHLGWPYGPDNGTIAPWAVATSPPFAPEIVLPAIDYYINQVKLTKFDPYGFKATFNPTYPVKSSNPYGWVSPWHYGLNQGPVILMIENYRTGLLWRLMRDCPYIASGLHRAGFGGGWL